jgi:CheY-like chemotaxis protein
MVVESNPEDQQFFRASFGPFGVPITTVSSSAEALSLIEDTDPCLVLISLDLEDGSATSLYHTLREEMPELPIVIKMDKADDEAIASILRDGPVTVLKKPIKRHHLKQVVQVYCHAED